MSFDSSRFSFDPLNDYLGVVALQGRPQLDSEWNEWLEEMQRRTQAGTLDTVGPAVVPSTTPDGFQLTPTTTNGATDLSVGQGRIYVEGFLAENHGLSPLSPKWVPPPAGGTDPPAAANATWDPALAEIFGNPSPFSYLNQPYFPNSGTLAPLPTTGTALFYLDVWRREVTYLQQPDLLEKALQTATTVTDTTGRFQTVWQVKFTANAGVTCATDVRTILPQSASRLTTDTTTATGSCLAPPGSGYLGTENRLYRVEIHQGGTQAQATFKWSRDNAAVATPVLAISSSTNTASLDTLQVQSLGTNLTTPLAPNDWIEIIDDILELNGQTGELHQIGSIQGLSLILSTPLTSTTFNAADPTRHTRIRRWDSAGASALPASGATMTLEDGITVAFNLDPAITNGQYATGDYWNFAARTADRSPDPNPIGVVEKLAQAPARGIHHHYANLALATFSTTAAPVLTDCRVFWPLIEPPACCCSVQVSPNDFAGDETLQAVLDRFIAASNGGVPAEICLSAGTYCLDQPLRLTTDHTGMTLKGCPGTVLAASPGSEENFLDGMVVVTGSLETPINITLEGIEFSMPAVLFQPLAQPSGEGTTPLIFAGLEVSQLPPALGLLLNNPNTPFAASIGVRPTLCDGLTIKNCAFLSSAQAQSALTLFWAGIFLQGNTDHLLLEDNTFQGTGIFAAGVLHAPAVAFNVAELPDPTAQTGFALLGGTVLPSTLDHAVIRNNLFGTRVSCLSPTQPHLTVAALVLGLGGDVIFTENEVGNSTAGFWMLSTLQARSIPYNLFVLQGAILAMGYPPPQGLAPNSGTTIPAFSNLNSVSALVFAGNSGAVPITDSQGTWVPDGGLNTSSNIQVSGGAIVSPFPITITHTGAPSTTITGPTVPAGDDPALYHSVREAQPGQNITYTFTPNNPPIVEYQVRIKFMDYKPVVNRPFNVVINGTEVLQGFDILSATGGPGIGIEEVFDHIPLVNGQVVVQLVSGTDVTGGAILSALKIQPQLQAGPESTSPALSFFFDLLDLAQMGFSGLPGPFLNLRVEDNDVSTEFLPALLVAGSPGDPQPTPPQMSLLTIFANTLQQAEVDWCSTIGVLVDFTTLLLTVPLGFWGIGSVSVNGNQVLNNNNGSFTLNGEIFTPQAIFFDGTVTTFPIVGNVFRGGMPDVASWPTFNAFIPY